MKNLKIVVGLVLFAGLAIAAYQLTEIQRASAQTQDNGASLSGFDAVVHSSVCFLQGCTVGIRLLTGFSPVWLGDSMASSPLG